MICSSVRHQREGSARPRRRAELGVARSRDPGPRDEIERGRAEGRIVGQVDRQPALADEQLGRSDVDRARVLQRDDAVDPPCGEMAERDRQGAHHPQAMGESVEARRILGDVRRRGRLEGEDLELVLRQLRQRAAVQKGAAASRRSPFLARPEVEDVAEDDVVHRAPIGDRDRDGEEGDPALRVQRAVDRVDDHRPATVAEASDLFADDTDVFVLEAVEDHPLRRCVDRGRLVAPFAGADDRLALGAAGQLFEHARDVVARRAAQLEPRAHTGWNRSPEVSLG